MEGWTTAKLGEVCELITRGIAPNYVDDGGVCVLNQRCVRDHVICYHVARRHDCTAKAVKADRFIQIGDVLVNSTGTGTLGRVAQVRQQPPEPTTVDTHVTIVRPKGGLFYPDFFGIMMLHIEGQLAASGEGSSGQTELSRTAISEKFEVSYPRSIAEQKRIVAILDEAFEGIDRAIANTEKNLANAQEIFESWHIGAFPSGCNGWTNTTLGAVAEFKNGLNFTKSSKGDTIKIVGVSDFQNNLWVPVHELDSVQIDGPLAEAYELREGDILTVRSNGNKKLIGRCVLAGPVTERTSHSGFTIRIRIIADKPNPKFLAQQLKSPVMRKRLVESGGGANISSLNQQALSALPISYPSFDEQTRIVEKFDSMNDHVARLERSASSKLRALAELKRSLLAKAFLGQLAAKRAPVVGAEVGSHQRTSEFCAAVLAFAYQRHAVKRRERTFGHVKAQKMLHLVESIAGVDLGRYPIKDAAGPNDFGHMLRAEEWAKSRGLFEFANRPNGYDFKPLTNFKKEVGALVASLSGHRQAIERVVDLLIPMNSEQAEVLATVHAAWNNLLADGKIVDDSAILYEARENWHPSKLKIAESKFRDAIKFIRAKGIVPDGSAKPVRGQDRLL